MSKNIKIYIIIAVVVVIIIALVYFQGKAAGTIKQVKLPNDEPGMKNLTDAEATQVREIARSLYEEMKGVNLLSRDPEPYDKLSKLSDTLFVAVYNDFNKNYGNGETLYAWMDGEYYLAHSFYLSGLVSNVIMPRMQKLNLV